MIEVQLLLNGKRLEFGVKSVEGLYALCIRSSIITQIKSIDNIHGINITKDFIILTKKDRAYRGGAKLLTDADFGERRVNNIEAYDWDGNLIWNIGDIVGDIGKPFYGCNLVTKDMLGSNMLDKIPESAASHDLLVCNATPRIFVVDLETREIIGQFTGRW